MTTKKPETTDEWTVWYNKNIKGRRVSKNGLIGKVNNMTTLKRKKYYKEYYKKNSKKIQKKRAETLKKKIIEEYLTKVK
jgi:hypothetical protein